MAQCSDGQVRGNIIEMSGQTFGRLKVSSLAFIRHRAFWNCVCECGNSTVVEGKKLRRGHTKSCGCLRNEKAAQRKLVHGHARRSHNGLTKRAYSREYQSWMNMKFRVRSISPKNKPFYLDRGITVSPRWNSFENFFADMGPCPPGLEIDRIDFNGNYEPGNCRWTDELTQGRNKRKRKVR